MPAVPELEHGQRERRTCRCRGMVAILGAIICLAVNAVEIPAAMNEGTETD
ncbi:MAG: hypothetical protein ACI4CE_00200 [Methanomethylophilus alvi]